MCITDADKIAASKPVLCSPPVHTFKAKLQACGPDITVRGRTWSTETWSDCAASVFWCAAFNPDVESFVEDAALWPDAATALAELPRLLGEEASPPPPTTDMLLSLKKTFTQAELLTLSSAPTILVPAPGASKVIVPIAVSMRLNFGTVAYSNGLNPSLLFGPPPSGLYANIGPPGFLQEPQDWTFAGLVHFPIDDDSAAANMENVDLYLTCSAPDPSGGDSTLTVVLFYAIADVS